MRVDAKTFYSTLGVIKGCLFPHPTCKDHPPRVDRDRLDTGLSAE